MDPYNLTEEDGLQYLENHGVAELLRRGQLGEISPKWDDLARLHILARERKPFQILEFGSGFSTIVLAAALRDNWGKYLDSGKDRMHPKPCVVAVESSEQWRANSTTKVESAGLSQFVDVVFSQVTIAEYQGQCCHLYDRLPDIVPDFVYLDGPDPNTVKGDINGISFENPQRTVMSADILKYESTLLPGFFMIVDGRTNNARFLRRMLTRDYDVKYHQSGDVTTFELNESRLGRKNVFGWEAYE